MPEQPGNPRCAPAQGGGSCGSSPRSGSIPKGRAGGSLGPSTFRDRAGARPLAWPLAKEGHGLRLWLAEADLSSPATAVWRRLPAAQLNLPIEAQIGGQ